MVRTLLFHITLSMILLAAGCSNEPESVFPSGPSSIAGSGAYSLSEPMITVDVVYPESGETLTYKEVVRWNATHSDSSPFMTASLRIDLHYSGDGGATWVAIALDGDNDGTHLWDVRGIPEGSGYLMRVTATDTNGVEGTDVSDSTFGITSRVFITDKKGKKWDITHAIEVYGMEPEGWHQGIGQYAIRPINDPQILYSGMVGYPADSESFEVVGAYLPNGEARAYPLPMIYYNEVVNDEAGDVPFAAVY
jgi:hypothetical protein